MRIQKEFRTIHNGILGKVVIENPADVAGVPQRILDMFVADICAQVGNKYDERNNTISYEYNEVELKKVDEKILSVVDRILNPTISRSKNSIHSRLRIGSDGRVRGPGMKGY